MIISFLLFVLSPLSEIVSCIGDTVFKIQLCNDRFDGSQVPGIFPSSAMWTSCWLPNHSNAVPSKLVMWQVSVFSSQPSIFAKDSNRCKHVWRKIVLEFRSCFEILSGLLIKQTKSIYLNKMLCYELNLNLKFLTIL